MNEQDERVVIHANSNVSRGKFAAAAVHAALTAAGVHPGLPVIVLGAKPADIGMLRTVIHDAGRTEVEPGTVTAGTDWFGGVSPTAPNEREDLFQLIYGYETIDFRESQNFTTRDCYGVVDAILRAGFRRSREATTEARPEPEWEYSVHLPDGTVAPVPCDRPETAAQWATNWTGASVVRRRPAGPWIPVEAVEAA